MATSPAEGMESLIRNLEASTGKSIADWITVARSTGLIKHKPLVDHLKQEYGVSHGYANQIALRALAPNDSPAIGSTEMVDAQFAGNKAAMRPIYDALIEAVHAFGPDVELSPKKAYVSLRRSKQFAIIQPSTAQRVDIGINLKGTPDEGRLEPSGSFNAMLTHRVRVSSLGEVNEELIAWLRKAYEES